MNRFEIDMTAEGAEALKDVLWMVLKLAECEGRDHRGKKRGITHYAIRPETAGTPDGVGGWLYGKKPQPLRLVFFDHRGATFVGGDTVSYPFTLDPDGVADFARRWLEVAEYGPEYDTDGHCQKGWRVHNGSGHMDDDWNAVIAVSPKWIVYGK